MGHSQRVRLGGLQEFASRCCHLARALSYLPCQKSSGMPLIFVVVQILLAMLARQVDWAVDDINEKINAFPIPSPVNGLPMKMWAM